MNISERQLDDAIRKVLSLYHKLDIDKPSEITHVLDSKDAVINRFQPIFSSKNIDDLRKEDFEDFLDYKHNCHWSGLQRHKFQITEDMGLLRESLKILLDETQPIENRIEQLLPKEGSRVKYTGRAILTAILLVAYPEKYGALNKKTQNAMEILDIWPEVDRKASFSARYVAVNEILLKLSKATGIDLWTLDAVWDYVVHFDEETLEGGDSEEEDGLAAGDSIGTNSGNLSNPSFGLERHLQDFLRDNWETISDFKDWTLYEEDGELVGYEYRTGVGYIDLLAKHKTDDRWLVIELKRDKSSDTTVGQVLRYMGWVKKELAEEGDSIEGLIISQRADKKLQYALEYVHGVKYLLYEVKFQLYSGEENSLD